jgi:hypothetical protein
MDAHVWLVTTQDAAAAMLDEAEEGDFALLPADAELRVGRVVGGGVVWLAGIDGRLLPDRERVLEADARYGRIKQVEETPELLRALRAIEQADTARGG